MVKYRMPKHIAGGKVNRSHTTIIDAAQIVIKTAESLTEVTKISLGVITAGLPTGIHRIKLIPITGGLRAEVRGSSSKQQLYIYTTNPEETERILSSLF